MNETTTLKSIRERVADELYKYVSEVIYRNHQPNYYTLFVCQDGTIWWSEEIDFVDYTDPRMTEQRMAVLAQIGAGSFFCDCDWCASLEENETLEDTALISETWSSQLEALHDALNEIGEGYFEDE